MERGTIVHGMHARLPKNFVLEERMERYADAIEVAPASWAGVWREACAPVGGPAFGELRVDLGCGKGGFLAESALSEPDVLFVGVDAEPVCVVYAAQRVMETGARNALVVPARGEDVCRIFAPGEVGRIHINFPTPFPRKRDAAKRLVLLDRLLEYRRVLAPGGVVELRTDSQPLYAFALGQFALAGYDVREGAGAGDGAPSTLYQDRLTAEGAKVLSLEATPGPDPGAVEQTMSLSLVDYLPDDLDAMDYVPLGMTGTVTNLRNHARKGGKAS